MREWYEDQVERRFEEQAKVEAFKERSAFLRHDMRRNGVKFWDANGKGRIVKGKKIYKG